MKTLLHHINKKIICFTIITIIIIITYIFADNVRDIINVLVISFIIANILNPIKNFFNKRYKNKKVISASIIIILIIIMILCAYLVIPAIYRELSNINDIVEILKKYQDKIENSKILKDSPIGIYIYNKLKEKLKAFALIIGEKTIKYLMVFGDKILSYAIVPILVYYFLSDRDNIANWIRKIIPKDNEEVFVNIYCECNRMLGRYLLGQIILSGIIFLLTLFPLFIFKVKLPILLAVINGILNIIPYFGPIVGIIFIVLVSLISTGSNTLLVGVILFLIQQLEGNLLSPKVIGDSTEMHPLLIIILLLIGEKVGGFVGMIVVVPIGVIIKVIIRNTSDYRMTKNVS